MNDDEVTIWMNELRQSDEVAAERLWRHFFDRLHHIARRQLHPDTRRVYDENDAAQSAFVSFCNGMAAGRFPDLSDRDGLWRLLLTITLRKIHHRHRYDHQEKRDIRQTVTESVFAAPGQSAATGVVDGLVSREPTPEFSAGFAETCDHLVNGLDDPDLSEIARLKLEGCTDQEIGDRLQFSRRTVQRRLEIVRRHWQKILESDAPD